MEKIAIQLNSISQQLYDLNKVLAKNKGLQLEGEEEVEKIEEAPAEEIEETKEEISEEPEEETEEKVEEVID